MGLFRRKPGTDGPWDVLSKWVTGKRRVDDKKIHDEGTRQLIPLLKPGMELNEGGDGWYRNIRMPEAPPTGMLLTTVMPLATIPPLPADELGPAPRKELKPGSPNEAEPAPRQAQGGNGPG